MLRKVFFISVFLALYQLFGKPSAFMSLSYYFCLFITVYFLLTYVLSAFTEILCLFSRKFEYLDDVVESFNNFFSENSNNIDFDNAKMLFYIFCSFYLVIFALNLSKITGIDAVTFILIPILSIICLFVEFLIGAIIHTFK